ncbi:MAG: lipopolysaccharide assembly protein LapB [Caldimonas sp.]
MDFELQWLLWTLPLAFALGWVASRLDVRQWRRDQKEPKAYHRGLNFLLNEEHDKAIDAFIEAVQQDPDTSDLHFALGNLFRRRGEYERAVRVHQYLLGRADLPKDERVRAQHALAQDYMKAGLFDRAEDAYKALAGGAFDTESRLALLDLHERAREWQAAIDVARLLESSGTGSFASRIAHYWCELALEADAAHQTEAADAAIAEARGVAPRDARPLLVAGEHAAARGDHAEALRLWNTLASVQPASFNLVARRYAASARVAGKIGSALERLRSLYEKAPTIDLLETTAALESDTETRHELLRVHLREHPTMAAAQALLASRTAAAPGNDGAPPAAADLPAEDATALSQAVRRAARPLHRYRCAACGFEVEHYFWQCPGCLGWDTYPPRRLEDL